MTDWRSRIQSDELVDQFRELTLLELSEFVKAFEETFEVTAAAPVAVAAAGGAVAPADAAEEQDQFDLVLEGRRRQEDPGHQGRS